MCLASTSVTMPSRRAKALTASSTKKDKRAPHIARPLNRFWQDIPAGSLASALPRAGHPEDAGSIHLKVGGQYLCATGSRGCAAAKGADSPAKPPPQSDAADACYLRCEPPVSVSSQLALANGKSASAGKGGDFGYRTAMAFKVERDGDGAFVDGATDEGFGVVSPGRGEELLSGATFRLKSELTGGYVCVGGLFQRYCLCASASSPADAATFQFVARRKPDDGAEPRGNQIFNPTSMCAYANVFTRALPLCFENSMRAIDPSKD